MLVQNLIENAILELKSKRMRKIKEIVLVVGESSGYSPESIKQAYEILREDADMKDTKLVLENAEGREVVLKRLVMED